MGQIQALLFGDQILDPNTLLEDALKQVEGARVLALPRDAKGPDRRHVAGEPVCLVCHRHVALYALTPCAHAVLCSACYPIFLDDPFLVCPTCGGQVTGVV